METWLHKKHQINYRKTDTSTIWLRLKHLERKRFHHVSEVYATGPGGDEKHRITKETLAGASYSSALQRQKVSTWSQNERSEPEKIVSIHEWHY